MRERPLDEIWQLLLRPPTRSMFSTAHVPGTDVGDDPAAEVPTPDQPTEHVALIRVVLDRVELLDIASRPHERVRFARAAGGWVGGRIAP